MARPRCRDRKKWSLDFKEYRKFAETENTPWIEPREDIFKDECIEPDEEESDASKFMHGPDEGDVCTPGVDRVESFCAGGTVDFLKSERWNREEQEKSSLALLEEKILEEGNVRPIGKHKPLSAQGLYHELRKPRFHVGGPHLPAKRSSPSGPAGPSREDPNKVGTSVRTTGADQDLDKIEPDVDCRLIFMLDPDRWSYLALMGTASPLQVPAMRGLLSRYLKFEPFFGVRIPPNGYKTFELAFHLPYFVWRRSGSRLEDHRSIRKCDDLSFFDYEGRKPSGFLYEAKASCVITGTDERTWCGYCFIESYFDSVKDAKETAVQYWEDSQLSEGMYADPFTYGTTDTDVQSQDPRVYFLVVLASRIKRVEREWSKLVEMLEESINESPKHYKRPWLLWNPQPTRKEAREDREKRHQMYNWITKADELSRKLLRILSETIRSWKQFWAQNGATFRDLPADGDDWIDEINETFQEISTLQGKVQSLKQECEKREKSFQSLLDYESRKEGNDLYQLAQQNKTFQLMMMLGFPLVLSSGVFSMNESASIVPLTPRSFVILVLCIGAVGIFVYLYQFYSCSEIIAEAVKKALLGAKLEVLHPKTLSPENEPSAEIEMKRVRTDVEDRAALACPVSSIKSAGKARPNVQDGDSQGRLPGARGTALQPTWPMTEGNG